MKLRPLEVLVASIYKAMNIPSDQVLVSHDNRTLLFNRFKQQLTSDDVSNHLLSMRKSGRLPKLRVKKERTRPILIMKKEEAWSSMDNPPQDDRVVIVDSNDVDGHPHHRYRLGYYYRPDPRSKEIGNKVAYWKWCDNGVGFNHKEGMRWKHV